MKDFKILIVDDNPRNVQLLGNVLLKNNYQVSFATDGYEALELVGSNSFDLILLDIMMPGMDGYDVCSKVREIKDYEEVPIIFLTAKTEIDHIIKGLNMGAQDFITKPFSVEELLARVNTHLDLRYKSLLLKNWNKDLEEKVEERTKELEDANNKLSVLEKAKSDFLNIISHELRTPLNGITGLAGILRDLLKDTDYAELIESLLEASGRLNSFTETAILITLINTDKYDCNYANLKIKDLISNCQEKKSDLAKKRKIVFVDNIEDHIHIRADKDLISIALNNIYTNAIQFTKVNSEILTNVYYKKNSLIIEIIDQGCGFDEEALHNLFELFANKDILHREGLGLGLAAAKLIMDMHFGNIEIKNHSHGAIVRLIFENENVN